MEDLRKNELEFIKNICDFLVDKFPDRFEYKQYIHPVLQEREELVIKDYKRSIDLNCIRDISLSVETKQILIRTTLGIFVVSKLFTDVSLI